MSSYTDDWSDIAHRVKREAGYRCVRCRHPDRPHKMARGKQPCDGNCRHRRAKPGREPEKQRVLTVHHLDGDKANNRWWNLAALCQVCHLCIQGKVAMEQTYSEPHSDWFLVYVAGYYAETVGGVELPREAVEQRLVECLAMGQPHLEEHYRERLAT